MRNQDFERPIQENNSRTEFNIKMPIAAFNACRRTFIQAHMPACASRPLISV
jgi:hypothetical protein